MKEHGLDGFVDEESFEEMVQKAERIIELAEGSLGPLTSGQRRDLLKDQTDWASDAVREIVTHLDEIDAERWRAMQMVNSFICTAETADYWRKEYYRV